MNRYLSIVLVFVVAVLVGRFETGDGRCQATYLRHGLDLPACPSGTIRQTARLEVSNLRRGAEATVRLSARAHYTFGDADAEETSPVARFEAVTLALIDARDVATPLEVKAWAGQTATIKLPEVPDGDYKLRASYATRLGAGELEVALPLYTPARVHVITDRPLYEPGNVVRFRAVVLRARDLAPLDGRPGRWLIKDPSGEVLLEEKRARDRLGRGRGLVPDRQGRARPARGRSRGSRADAIDEVDVHGRAVQAAAVPRRGDARPAVLRIRRQAGDPGRGALQLGRAGRERDARDRVGDRAATGRRRSTGRRSCCRSRRRPARTGGSSSRCRRSPRTSRAQATMTRADQRDRCRGRSRRAASRRCCSARTASRCRR